MVIDFLFLVLFEDSSERLSKEPSLVELDELANKLKVKFLI